MTWSEVVSDFFQVHPWRDGNRFETDVLTTCRRFGFEIRRCDGCSLLSDASSLSLFIPFKRILKPLQTSATCDDSNLKSDEKNWQPDSTRKVPADHGEEIG